MHAYRSLDKGNSTYATYLNLLVGMVLVLAHKLHIALMLRLLNILDGDLLLTIHIYRQ